jgi:hypothetical protein
METETLLCHLGEPICVKCDDEREQKAIDSANASSDTPTGQPDTRRYYRRRMHLRIPTASI